MSVRITTCPICGEQTGVYEAGRIESVAANKCKCPPAPAPRTVTEERWGIFDPFSCSRAPVLYTTEQGARAEAEPGNEVVRVTLTYTVPEAP